MIRSDHDTGSTPLCNGDRSGEVRGQDDWAEDLIWGANRGQPDGRMRKKKKQDGHILSTGEASRVLWGSRMRDDGLRRRGGVAGFLDVVDQEGQRLQSAIGC